MHKGIEYLLKEAFEIGNEVPGYLVKSNMKLFFLRIKFNLVLTPYSNTKCTLNYSLIKHKILEKNIGNL